MNWCFHPYVASTLKLNEGHLYGHVTCKQLFFRDPHKPCGCIISGTAAQKCADSSSISGNYFQMFPTPLSITMSKGFLLASPIALIYYLHNSCASPFADCYQKLEYSSEGLSRVMLRKFNAKMCSTVWTFNTSHRFHHFDQFTAHCTFSMLEEACCELWFASSCTTKALPYAHDETGELLYYASNVWFASEKKKKKKKPEVVKRSFWMGTHLLAEYCVMKEANLLPEP